jgi:hypothetical protein
VSGDVVYGVRDGAELAVAAQRAAADGVPGYYVLNERTGVVVRGPFAVFSAADRVARAESGIDSYVVEGRA